MSSRRRRSDDLPLPGTLVVEGGILVERFTAGLVRRLGLIPG